MTISILDLNASKSRENGHIHGESLRQQIKEFADIRLMLALKETEFKKPDLIDLASRHLPILRQFDEELFSELQGISEASHVSLEHLVILNHYTDLRDIKPGTFLDANGGCSALFVPTLKGPILGQTWDISGYALDYVTMLRIDHDTLVFSVAGCLGMTGMNAHGVGVTINNLNSIDAKIGVVWPALVRKILRQKSAKDGRDVVLSAPLGSGHHYIIADRNDFFGIETSGTKKKITQQGANQIHTHTNHCINDEMAELTTIRKTSTTHQRYDELQKIIKEGAPQTPEAMFESFGRVSMSKNLSSPEMTATCGAIVMDLLNGTVLACKGPPSSKFNNLPTQFTF